MKGWTDHGETARAEGSGETDGKLTFDSSSPEANEAFTWARSQALAYAFSHDPVGPWYEAALPGREAFCMRDVSHQAMGAHALGLAANTKNMLRRFAENVSESRDWCSLWEIDRYGSPPLADYLNDDEFWFCLPANFDVLDCCRRMYGWTGDRDYLLDPAFLEFYRRTVYEYVERWDLGIDKIMKRQRILNARADLASGSRLTRPRGIPGYNEESWDFTAGFDLLAAMYAGYRAYAGIQDILGNRREASTFRDRASAVRRLIHEVWWDEKARAYFDFTDASGTPIHGDRRSSFAALYWRTTDDREKLRAIVERTKRDAPDGPSDGVEGQSHLAEVLYRYGEKEAAYRQLLYVSKSRRREYPEVSYSVIGAMVTGLMGIELDFAPPSGALKAGDYVDRTLSTTPRIPDAGGWAHLEHLRVRGNIVTVRHEGMTRTTVTNFYGPSLIWKARFPGSRGAITADGGSQRTVAEEHPVTGEAVAAAEVIVGAGESITAEVR